MILGPRVGGDFSGVLASLDIGLRRGPGGLMEHLALPGAGGLTAQIWGPGFWVKANIIRPCLMLTTAMSGGISVSIGFGPTKLAGAAV